ncbi:MAG TPA: SH3 domain-containing protein [Fluviicola sp.]|nr:SH3 domain-containing protein [Fluviicola sp.]
MKIFASLLLALSFSTAAFCDEEYEPYEFYAGDVAYVLGDSVNIRESASTSAKAVAVVSIGTKVTILEKTDVTLNLNGFTMSWYEVSFNGGKKGYVWGGKLAMKSFRSSKNTDYIFHFGLEKMVDGESTYQIRVEKNHKEVQRLSFEGFRGEQKPHEITNHGNRGLTNVDDVLYVDASAEFCGDDGGSIVFFWSNNKLQLIQKLYHVADAPVFATDDFIFPADMDGKKGQILLHEEVGEDVFSEDGTSKIVYEKNETTAYQWDGKKMVKK